MTTTLPDAAWRHDPAMLAVVTALGGVDQTRAVGGAVRDTLLGLPVNDVDFATRLRPDAVIERLTAAGIKAVPTGIAHGTITAVADGRPFEITTLRRDVATDGRHATIEFADDWAEDAARRDFTINALYADPVAGTLFDPVGGLADLAAHRVLFIGDAAQRIDEDHLRILRWFRFLARFGDGVPDAATLTVVAGRAAKLRGLSRERVADELTRILSLPDPVPSVALMVDTGVLAEIAPEALPDGVARLRTLVTAEVAAPLPADPARRLIALLPTAPLVAEQVASRLKLSNRLRKRIAVARSGGIDGDPRALAYRLGSDGAMDRLLLAGEADAIATIRDWPVPKLPVSGGDIVATGVTAGPEVARLLRAVEERWVAEGFPPRIDLDTWLASEHVS